jgi:hypothetical protein
MTQVKPHTDILGRILGIVILLAGIAMLVLVFTIANHLFRTPIVGLASPSNASSAATIGMALAEFVKKLLMLAVMTVVGSLIASKGVDTYFHAIHWAQTHPSQSAPPSTEAKA